MKEKKGKEIPEIVKTDTNSFLLFDKKVKIFIGGCLILYVLLSLMKIQTSSIPIWDQFFGINKPKSLVAGSPRGIRQDEWMVVTPALIGHLNVGMPTHNIAIGDANSPILLGFPYHDYSMVFRPYLWSYFIFDAERAFAFSWNFIICFFIISTFLLFMMLTRNDFWLSIFGAFFIFLSSVMQWWSYSFGIYMIYLNGIAISFLFILFASDKIKLSVAALFLLICSFSFIVGMYPPWQIPMIYLYVFIIAGYILKHKSSLIIKQELLLKVSLLSSVGIILVLLGLHHYGLVKDTFEILVNTAYPGKRSTNGGDLIQGKLFSEFFGMFITDVNVPVKWLNICEASNFIMFFPIIFYAMGYDFIKSRTIDIQSVFVSIFILIALVWVILGFPEFLSKVSLLSMSPPYRTLPVLGMANAILLVTYLSNNDKSNSSKINLIELGILALATFVFIRLVSSDIQNATGNFFKSGQILVVSLIFTLIYLLIRFKRFNKYVKLSVMVILILISLPNIKIHPLTSGLNALLSNPIVKITKEISEKDTNARWALFGNQMLSNLLKVNGIKVLNGVKYTPLLNDMKVLDPSGKDNFIYNRYAHINMAPYIDLKDSVIFRLNENEVVNDNYSIYMDPCSPRMVKLGVKYVVFTYQPQPAEIRCMDLISSNGVFIYKIK